ncbi:hypothetical protein Xen7305DRAFT_00030800 [Xenococcus sp. PCC 7305]|nr:hypothetical protein Xen7305DRAFT_00030800 [Xenococcus sp. PCC 7305]
MNEVKAEGRGQRAEGSPKGLAARHGRWKRARSEVGTLFLCDLNAKNLNLRPGLHYF